MKLRSRLFSPTCWPFSFRRCNFFSRKRIRAGIISLILFVVSIPLLVVGIGLIVWLFDAAWAMWNLKHEIVEAHIQDQANRIAKAMREEKAA